VEKRSSAKVRLRRVDGDIPLRRNDQRRDQQDARTRFRQPSAAEDAAGAAIQGIPIWNIARVSGFNGDRIGYRDLDADLVARKVARSGLGELFEHRQR